ncbi:MAG: EAL domain-containing protein [Mariprofundales bacterium]
MSANKDKQEQGMQQKQSEQIPQLSNDFDDWEAFNDFAFADDLLDDWNTDYVSVTTETVDLLLLPACSEHAQIMQQVAKTAFGEKCSLNVLKSETDVLNALRQQTYAACLFDRTGDFDVLNLIHDIHAYDPESPPILLLNNIEDEDCETEAMLAGVADYLIFSQLNAPLLARAVRYAIKRHNDAVELHRSRASLSKAQRIANIGNWDWDMRRKQLFCSDELQRLFGLLVGASSLEALLGRIYPKDINKVRAHWSSAIDDHKAGCIEYRILLPGGEMRTVYEQIEISYDALKYVQHVSGIIQDITERKNAEQAMHRLAYYDELTGLPNRRQLFDALTHALQDCSQSSNNEVNKENTAHIKTSNNTDYFGAVLFFDLDHFKQINDTLGHEAGDILLQGVARRLRASLRSQDTIGRLGGDEFIVILDRVAQTEEEASTRVLGNAKRLREQLIIPFDVHEHQIRITPSIGIALFSGNHDGTASDILKNADIAMYHAKSRGRNNVCAFTSGMSQQTNRTAQLQHGLSKAIYNHELYLNYQAQVNEKGVLMGAETLLRWQHPQLGNINPSEFLPLAEEGGQIEAIEQWVLDTACRQLARWQKQDNMSELCYLAVNLTPRQFEHPDFIKNIVTALVQYNIDPRALELEITEQHLLHNSPEINKRLQQLNELGVTIALDDFGTGHSSLAYLGQFPIARLKLDRLFVERLDQKKGAVLVQSILDMANKLDISVVAEGIEEEWQWRKLCDMGCCCFQGYYFMKAVSAHNFAAQITKKYQD